MPGSIDYATGDPKGTYGSYSLVWKVNSNYYQLNKKCKISNKLHDALETWRELRKQHLTENEE